MGSKALVAVADVNSDGIDDLLRLGEGRLADSRILLDRLTMLEQLGALPTPQTGD